MWDYIGTFPLKMGLLSQNWVFVNSFCDPNAFKSWASITNQLGRFTPCFTDIFIIGSAHLTMLILCIVRLRQLVASRTEKKYILKTKSLSYLKSALAGWCALVPVMQLSGRASLAGVDEGETLAPFEVVSLILASIAWLGTCLVYSVERHRNYVINGAWLMPFAVLFVFAGQLAKLRFVLLLNGTHSGFFFNVYLSLVLSQLLLGLFALFYFPALVPKPCLEEDEIDEPLLPEAAREAEIDYREEICPERKANVFSRYSFNWMSPLMVLGYKRPLQDADVWQLDSWDRTETLSQRFGSSWAQEMQRPNPSLLWALHRAYGLRFWLGGLFKIGQDASQFVGPTILSLLLESIQNGDPPVKGYTYGALLFLGQLLGVLSETQYFQNVMRVGFWVRSSLVSAVFRKSLFLSHQGRQAFSSGRITNLISSDTESLQMVLQNLHNLWSAPIRIAVAMLLLYFQLGIASVFSLLVLVLLIPIQALIISRVQKLVKATLQRTDKRVDLMNEILGAMDVVKCYAWEESFSSRVEKIRDEELTWLKKSAYLSAVNYFILNVVPVLVSVMSFGVYAWLGGELTAAKAFTAITLFNILRFPLYTFPQLIAQVTSAKVSLSRLQELLAAEERDLKPNPPIDPTKPAIKIADVSFTWDAKAARPNLQEISLEVPVGSLVAIVGGTGQGKSSLVSAILGEMPTVAMTTLTGQMRGKVAYVPQTSWIFNATVRDNILFGSPFDERKYEVAIQASSLARDLELLQGGDLTEIGERGVNVSGGQKQRIAIARAIYSDADVYIFDDPLSALDAHVGKEVFNECIAGLLSPKTRIMVTNQLHFLPHVDQILVMHEGRIIERGKFQELQKSGSRFQALLAEAGSMEDAATETKKEKIDENDENSEENKPEKPKKSKTGTLLVKEEERETGMVHGDVIWRYVAAMGGTFALVALLVFYIVIEGTRVWASIWLSVWSGAGGNAEHGTSYYIAIYALISGLQMAVTLGNQLWLAVISVLAARRLHEGMLNAIFRAPMSFFHANPAGRLINRFTKDMGDVDKNLSSNSAIFLRGLFQLTSTFALIGFVTPFILTAFVPVLFAFYILYQYFQNTAREVKRLDAISRSPVYNQFGEALSGLATIRAYRAQNRLITRNNDSVDHNTRYILLNMSANRWLAVRLELLGGTLILATAVFAVLDSGNVGGADRASFAPQIGLVLSYALSITGLMTMTLRLASVFENSFNSVERIGTYTDLEPEAPRVIDDCRPPLTWPAEGAILFNNVFMRYRPDLPHVLRGLTAQIKPSEKVGVVGRTGAGKSTLFNALFRIVEIESGTVSIDEYDVSKFGVADVRKRLSIIPQTPVLFTGTIRFNLDPFGEHSDVELWESLGRAHLKETVARSPAGLDTEVAEGGDNFSVGQRQLLSLARALLRKSKILVLDEATAAVDMATDALIQKTIREEFRNCTTLTIAHRLNTIIDSDRILVLDAGKALEFDHASRLLANPSGLFNALVQSTGISNALYLKRVALGELDIHKERNESALEGQKALAKEAAARRWASATRWALATTLHASQGDLQQGEGDTVQGVREAVSLLRSVLAGEKQKDIGEELERAGISEEKWYHSLSRVVEALGTMARQARTKFLSGDKEEGQGWKYLTLGDAHEQ